MDCPAASQHGSTSPACHNTAQPEPNAETAPQAGQLRNNRTHFLGFHRLGTRRTGDPPRRARSKDHLTELLLRASGFHPETVEQQEGADKSWRGGPRSQDLCRLKQPRGGRHGERALLQCDGTPVKDEVTPEDICIAYSLSSSSLPTSAGVHLGRQCRLTHLCPCLPRRCQDEVLKLLVSILAWPSLPVAGIWAVK